MDKAVHLDNFKKLFYQSKFRKLISSIENLNQPLSIYKKSSELALLKASAFYELNQISKSISSLKEFVESNEHDYNENYLYALGRLSYMDNDLDRAEEIFLDLIENTDNEDFQFKSLLGLANVLYSKDAISELEPIIFDLEGFKPRDRDDENISLSLFLGNYQRSLAKCIKSTMNHFTTALELSAKNGWNFFICRSIYGQATVYERFSKIDQMNWSLELLKAFIDKDESIFFSSLVNRKFESYAFKLSLPIQFDESNQRIRLENDWLPLHDRPLLYKFLESIHSGEQFTSKGSIARALWPDQEYKPRVHDPRIFDIAKRAKNLIEKNNMKALMILSGRSGYKLTSAKLG